MYTHILIGLWAVGMLSCLFVFTFISDAISSLENNLWIPWSLKGWQHTCKACCDLIGQRCFIESQPNTMFGKEHFQRHGTVWFQRCIPDAHWETGRNLIKSQFNIMLANEKLRSQITVLSWSAYILKHVPISTHKGCNEFPNAPDCSGLETLCATSGSSQPCARQTPEAWPSSTHAVL